MHLVGTPDGLMHRSSAILVIKIRWADGQTPEVQDSLSNEEELQLQGYMLICPGATHVEFVQGWRAPDGSYKYMIQKLLIRKQPESKAVIAQRQVQVAKAMHNFGSQLHGLLHDQVVQDIFVRSKD